MNRRICFAGLIIFFSLNGISSAAEPYVWKSAQIVGGGFVTGIITHPAVRGLMYARTDIGGAYRWDTQAKSWAALTDWTNKDTWNFTGIESIAVDANAPDKLYMAVGTYTNSWAGNGAMLRSNDRGNTWQRTDLPFKNGGNEDGRFAGERLVVDPNDSSILFFGSRRNGLWKSDDASVTWSLVASFPHLDPSNKTGIVAVLFDPAAGKPGQPTPVIYAAVSSSGEHLYRSADGGATWIAPPNQPNGLRPNHISWSANHSLVLSYGDQPGPNGMSDGAIRKLDVDTNTWTDITPLHRGDGDNFGYGAVAVDPRHPNTLLASTMDRWARGDEIFRSTNGGKTWTGIGKSAQRDPSLAPWLTWGKPAVGIGHWIGYIAIDPFDSDHAMYVTGMGIWAADDLTAADTGRTTHWHVGCKGLEECVVREVLSPPTGAHLLTIVWDIDGFRHTDLNESPRDGFFRPSHGSCSGIDFAEKNPDILARVFDDRSSTCGQISRDNGITWMPFAHRPTNAADGFIALSADGKNIVWSSYEGAEYVSSDDGSSWIQCAGIPPKLRVVSDRQIMSNFYAFDNSNGTIYVSTDAGKTFTTGATNLPRQEGFLRCCFGEPGDLWLATDAGLFRSTDAGATFSRQGGDVRAFRIGFGKAAPDESDPAIYLVGTVDGVYGFYRSDDQAKNWVRINDDRHQYAWVGTITGDPRLYGRVYIGSGSRGVLYGDTAK